MKVEIFSLSSNSFLSLFTLQLHDTETPGDILVFLTGMDEVDQCISSLREYARDKGPNKHGLKIWPVPMYGALSPHDQLKAFRPATRGSRKVRESLHF